MPKRIQRQNTVYVGISTKWDNPFNWKDADGDTIPENVAKQYAKELYESWLNGDYFAWADKENLEDRRQWILDHIHELKNSDLSCWCSLDEPCHADVLLEIANKE